MSLGELVIGSMLMALTSSKSLSKTENTLLRDPLADTRGNSVRDYESIIEALNVKKMQESGPSTRFSSG